MPVQDVKRPAVASGTASASTPSAFSATLAMPEPVGMPAEPLAAEHTERRQIDGLAWTYRRRFGGMLEALPATAWGDPAGQGWQRVKHNVMRAVWRAQIDGATYYLKYYTGPGWAARLKRLVRGPACKLEWESGIYAAEVGIPTIRPVGYSDGVRYEGRVCSLLVTAAVEPAYPLHEYWEVIRRDDDAHRRRRDSAVLIDLLAEMIARAHQGGFEHRDMHAANILVHPVAPGRYQTVFVDLQSARLGMPLSDRAVVRNLGQLNQWFRRHSGIGDRLRFLRAYLRWRNEYEPAFAAGRPLGLSFDGLVGALVREADRRAERLWAKRDRRARRSGRYFARLNVPGGWRGMVFLRTKRPVEESRASAMVLDRTWWRAQLKNPLRWFESDTGQPCKESHSALVARATLATERGELSVIVKRPRARNWRRRLRQFIAPSRSMRGWRAGHALLNRDIPAARPLAVLERRMGPLVLDSVLLTEALADAANLTTHLRREYENRPSTEWWRHKRALSERLVQHLRQLADRGFVHRDCKAENVLVVTRPRLKLLWIDLDGLRRVRQPSMARQLRALVRLHVSLLEAPGLTRSDRLRFLKGYFARFGSAPQAWRSAWGQLGRASEKKIRARRRRQQWKLEHYGRV